MKFTLTFNTDSAAFDGDLQGEIYRILFYAAREVQFADLLPPRQQQTLADSYGNTVGHYILED